MVLVDINLKDSFKPCLSKYLNFEIASFKTCCYDSLPAHLLCTYHSVVIQEILYHKMNINWTICYALFTDESPVLITLLRKQILSQQPHKVYHAVIIHPQER